MRPHAQLSSMANVNGNEVEAGGSGVIETPSGADDCGRYDARQRPRITGLAGTMLCSHLYTIKVLPESGQVTTIRNSC